jgi:hypothetical protein
VNSATFSGIARTGLVAIVLVLAIVAGLAVGNAINGRGGTLNGYPAGWRGGAAVPVSRVADTSFSLDAVRDIQALRNDAAAPAFLDYALRHGMIRRGEASNVVPEYSDYVGQGSETNDGSGAPAGAGPVYIDHVDAARQRSAATKGMAPEYIDHVDAARQRSAANKGVAPEYIDYVDQARQRSATTDPVKATAPAPIAPGI